jgi:mono/diheme cytochrome c family protein
MPALAELGQQRQGDRPGLALTIASLAPDTVKPAITDVRVSRMLALYVPAGHAASAFTAAGPFRATFEGNLNLRIRDFYEFRAEGRGRLTLKINGQAMLDVAGDDWNNAHGPSLRLNKGKNHLVATYESAASGDSAVRVFWVPKGQLPEPIPPMVLTHDAAAELVRLGERVRTGRFLVAEFRCTRCHAGSQTPQERDVMPELSQDAPSFAGIGARLNAAWMAAWINNPRAMRASRVHMPRLFHGNDDPKQLDPRARDIAAYLTTLTTANAPEPAQLASNADILETGGRTFANLNCVACHMSPERTQPGTPQADEGRIALAQVKAKFRPAALVQFLLKPEAHDAWIPMPNFRLSTAEAESLAVYLLSLPMKAAGASDAVLRGGNVANGEKLLHSSGCLNCHTLKDDEQPGLDRTSPRSMPLASISPDRWTRGCMASNDAGRGAAPDFGFDPGQRDAILAFAATDLSSLSRDAAPEFAERQIAALRCTACHARDGKESLLATVLDTENQELKALHPPVEAAGLEGVAPDQRAPMLTWAGGKLRPEWMGQFIAGQVAYKPRYYLSARMPGFPARGNLLAVGLAEEHGCTPTYPPYAQLDRRLAAIGQKLAGKAPNESFGCVQCHAINNQPPLAPFEAPAPNFMYVTQRLRLDYYYRWVHNPLRIDPESKMPRFDDDEGKTGITTLLGGNAHQQFDALWNYMLLGKDMQPPTQ